MALWYSVRIAQFRDSGRPWFVEAIKTKHTWDSCQLWRALSCMGVFQRQPVMSLQILKENLDSQIRDKVSCSQLSKQHEVSTPMSLSHSRGRKTQIQSVCIIVLECTAWETHSLASNKTPLAGCGGSTYSPSTGVTEAGGSYVKIGLDKTAPLYALEVDTTYLLLWNTTITMLSLGDQERMVSC